MTFDRAPRASSPGLVFSPPENHPITALPAGRGYYRVEEHAPDTAHDFARAAFHAYFAEGRDMTEPATVAAVGASLGLPVAELEAGITTEAIKSKVKTAGDEAIANGAFGSPFFLVDGEPFWGVGRMRMLDAWLVTQQPDKGKGAATEEACGEPGRRAAADIQQRSCQSAGKFRHLRRRRTGPAAPNPPGSRLVHAPAGWKT